MWEQAQKSEITFYENVVVKQGNLCRAVHEHRSVHEHTLETWKACTAYFLAYTRNHPGKAFGQAFRSKGDKKCGSEITSAGKEPAISAQSSVSQR